MAIRSFRDKVAAALFLGLPVKGLPHDLRKRARTKLAILNRAMVLDDLRVPPGNRLEALKGGRAGQYSVRVNDQYRLCFTWTGADAENVEFVDYH
jgi:proteic killer suppression protein